MEIQYFGQSCFQIKGKKAIVVTDPFQFSIGLKLPKIKADIVTVSHYHEDHDNFQSVQGNQEKAAPILIDRPGEYEIAGINILGLNSSHGNKLGRNTIYIYHFEDLLIAHLGDLGELLTDDQLDNFETLDILFVPVGGKYTLDASRAVAVVKQLEPKIVVPMHYQLPGLSIDLKPVTDFLKEFETNKIQKLDKLSFSKEKLPEEQQIIVLNVRN